MHDDKFLNKVKPGLYCVATPIGNLGDITLRAINILKNSDVILCEDTRISKKLLNHLKINKELISYHKFNEQKKLKQILGLLRENKIISIISDAGTPTISDPGKILIRECIKEGLDIYPIPGPSAVSASISISGFSDKYLFLGFLPEKKRDLTNQFKKVSQIGCSIVFFISPNKFDKIKDQLKNIKKKTIYDYCLKLKNETN